MNEELKQRIQKVGVRIYNSGDMANFPTYGTVKQVLASTKYTPESVVIVFDDARFEGDTKQSTVPVYVFSKGPGCRYWLAEDYDARHKAECDAAMERMQQFIADKKAG